MAGLTQYTEQELSNKAHDADVQSLHSSAARTATGETTGVDLGPFDEALVLLNVTAASGTSPTLDVKIQTSDDNSDWYDLGSSFSQVTAVSKPSALKITNFGKYVRAVYTIGGGTPSFTFTIKLVSKVIGA